MNLERIASLLAAGLPAVQVATIVGLSQARISQLQTEQELQDLITAKQAEIAGKDIEELSISAKYAAAEHALIGQVMEMAPVSELRDVTAALRVVAERQEKAKSRMNPILQQRPVYNNIVTLQLPGHALPEVQFNAEKEVIAIGNRNLSPLSSVGVLSLFSQIGNNQDQRISSANSDGGQDNDTTRASSSAEENAAKAISAQVLANGARKFLDSLHPAPFASTF